jgi:hypothetical protein
VYSKTPRLNSLIFSLFLILCFFPKAAILCERDELDLQLSLRNKERVQLELQLKAKAKELGKLETGLESQTAEVNMVSILADLV